MKKSGNNRKKIIVTALVICLVFAAGIGIGTLISGRTAKGTASTESKDAAQNGSNAVKSDIASSNTSGKDKEDADSPADDGKNDDTDSKTDVKTDSKADADNKDKQPDASADNGSNGQSGSQSSAGTYDASIPDDDTSIHRYEYFVEDCTWQQAFQNCINKGGYLARINSSKEYETIRKEITSQRLTNIYFRIGGRRDSQSQDYYWVNEDNRLFGEKLNSDSSWCSDEWMKGEPSFKDGSLEEKYMDLFFFDGEKRFVWNDVPDDMLAAEPAYSGIIGYICEYEE